MVKEADDQYSRPESDSTPSLNNEGSGGDPKVRASGNRRNYEAWRNTARREHAQFFAIYAGFLDFLDKRRDGPKLTSTDIRLYLWLGLRANRAGESWYGVERIARELGLGERTVQRAFEHLKAAGLIDRFSYRDGSSYRTFLLPYPLSPVTPEAQDTSPTEEGED